MVHIPLKSSITRFFLIVFVYIGYTCQLKGQCVDCKISASINNGLVACYPFNGNTDDESNNGNNGTAKANAKLTTDRKNKASKAYIFDGSPTSRINVPASALLNTANMSGFTYTCWFNASSSSTHTRIINIQDAALINYDLSFLSGTNKLNFINYDGVNNHIYFNSNTTFSLNTWYHMAIVIDANNTPRLYVNGVLDNSSSTTVLKPSNPVYTIGNHTVNAWNFVGKIDDIRVYNRALSAAEIMALFLVEDPLSITPIPDKTICKGDSVRLTASGGISYSWSPAAGLSDPNIANPYVKPASNQQYIVTISNGTCNINDTVEVRVIEVNANAGSDQALCFGDSIQLNASGGTSYTWFNHPTLSGTTIPNPYVKPMMTTTYKVIISDGICSRVDSVEVYIGPTLTVSAGIDTSICLADSVQLQAIGGSKFTWTPVNGLSRTDVSNPKASPGNTTDFIVTGTSLLCHHSDTIRVTVHPKAYVNLGFDTIQCKDYPITFNPSVSDADIYSWQPSTAVSDPTILNPFTTTKITRTFILTATNSVTGCVNSDTIVVNIQKPIAEFSLDKTIIFSPPFIVTPHNTSRPTPLTYNWEMKDSVSINYTSMEPTHTFSNPGTYTILLTVMDNKGCIDTVSKTIQLYNEARLFIPNVFTPNGDGLNDVFKVSFVPGTILGMKGTIWNRWGAKIYEFSSPDYIWWNGKSDGQDASAGVYFYIIEVVNLQNEVLKFNGTVTLLR